MNVRISILTATLNSATTLQDCLKSVGEQTVQCEHIIIDGGSSDNTVAIAESYPSVTRIISEPDKGIYDAMNKGIAVATGDIIGILNSDDYFAHRDVLKRVYEVFVEKRVDSCYGDLVYVDAFNTNRVRRVWISGAFDYRRFYWGWMPPHPTFFVRRAIYDKFGTYNVSLGTSADYEFMLRVLVKYRISSVYIPDVLVKMRIGGVSNKSFLNRLAANRMDRLAWKVNALKPLPWTLAVKPLSKIPQFFRNNAETARDCTRSREPE